MCETKTCKKCGETKNKILFSSHRGKKGNKDGLQPWCKQCTSKKSKDWMKKYKEKNRNNPRYRIDKRMSKNISKQLKSKKDGQSWKILLGYSAEELIIHLESKFQPGMTWENYGVNGWHIDHIIPKSFFEYDGPDENFKACWALENLQPLWADENRKKSNRVPNPFVQILDSQAQQ